MKIKVYDEKTNTKKEESAKSITELAEKLNINLEEVIIIKNNEITTEDEKIKNGDEIKFLSVISGG
jgi:sulfur carrier protein ThiS